MAFLNPFGRDPRTDEEAGQWAGVPFIGKQKFGYYQYLKGLKQESELDRPTYEIPDEILQNLSEAQRRSIQGLPEDQKRQYIENLQRGMTTNLANLTGRKAGLVGVGNVAQAQTDAYRNLLGMDVQAREANQDKLTQQRAIMGDQKSLQWQINQMQPYLQKYGESQKLIGAGTQNIMQGTTESTKVMMDYYGQIAELGTTAATGGV